MHAFLQHAHTQRAVDEPAERGGAPDLLVVAAFRVEAHDERGLAEGAAERREVRRQIAAARFLARLDEHQAARQPHPLLFQRGDRGERAEHRVAIVRRAAPVEPSVADHRLPGSEAGQPAGELRLLVEVPVEQHGTRQLSRHVDQQERGAARQTAHLDARAGKRLGAAPVRHQLHRRLHVTVALPVRVELRRLVGDAHVRDQPLDDGVVPGLLDRARQALLVHGFVSCV